MLRRSSSALLVLGALGALGSLVASGCSDSVDPATSSSGNFRVINATSKPIDILVDGNMVAQGAPAATVSTILTDLSPGIHQVHIQQVNGPSTDLHVNLVDGRVLTAFALPAGSAITANVLVDTGAVVPAGKSKVRLIHLAPNAPALENWRTQPDFQTAVHIMTPFAYQGMSPYLQSDPGTWEVWVTAPGGGTKLATTGAVNVPGGERRTVVLLDSAGVLRLRVMDN